MINNGCRGTCVPILSRRCHIFAWASPSLRLLEEWNLLDWLAHGGPVVLYLRYVRKGLEAICLCRMREAVSKHAVPVSYLSYSHGFSPNLVDALSLSLPWHALASQRALARFRAGLVEFGHDSGNRTRARVQSCIFCGARVRSPPIHCLLDCKVFLQKRSPLVLAYQGRSWSRLQLSRQLLGLHPGHPVYVDQVQLIADMEKASVRYWSQRN